MIINYSIYKFRFDWKYINLAVLKTLWEHHGSMSDYSDNVIDKIKKSDIGHKFSKDMYIKLMKYIKAPADAKLINEVKKSNVLNVFYIFVIKIAVAEPLYLNIDYDKINHGILITLINELSRHDELLQCRDLRSCIYSMEFHYFSKLNYIP